MLWRKIKLSKRNEVLRRDRKVNERKRGLLFLCGGREGLSDKVTFEQRKCHGNAWRKAVSGRVTSAKVLKQEHAWCVGEIARITVWLEWSKTGAG